MLFLVVLVAATALAALVLTLLGCFSPRDAARWGMASAMCIAGLSHWVMPLPFVQHLPPWVPAREALILVTGVIEVALGLALLAPAPRRRLAGATLAGYLVAVFPANIYVAVAGVDVQGQPGGIYPWLRLPFQLLFIAWALWCVGNGSPGASAIPGLSASRGPERRP